MRIKNLVYMRSKRCIIKVERKRRSEMLCQHCKKQPATIDYVEEINGSVFESHLCAQCYAELYGELNSKVNEGLWAGLFSTAAPYKKKCPVCGTRYSDYERTGLLGCASCYDVFKEELVPSIKRIQGKDIKHVGKSGGSRDELGLHRKLKNLQERLETALREKRFNEAGALNRQINEISKKLYGGNGNG